MEAIEGNSSSPNRVLEWVQNDIAILFESLGQLSNKLSSLNNFIINKFPGEFPAGVNDIVKTDRDDGFKDSLSVSSLSTTIQMPRILRITRRKRTRSESEQSPRPVPFTVTVSATEPDTTSVTSLVQVSPARVTRSSASNARNVLNTSPNTDADIADNQTQPSKAESDQAKSPRIGDKRLESSSSDDDLDNNDIEFDSDSDFSEVSHSKKQNPDEFKESCVNNTNLKETAKVKKTKSPTGKPRSEKQTTSAYKTNECGDFICEICNKTFVGPKGRKNLKEHLDIHSGIRKFQCPFCDAAFRQRRPRRTHIRRVHESHRTKTFQCQYCEKKFCSPQEKKIHERVHTGEKPNACDLCDYTSTQAYNVIRHKRTKHFNERNHLCSQCGKCFNSENTLKTHEKKVHDELEQTDVPRKKKEKIIPCKVCDKFFCDKRNANLHMKKFHKLDTTQLNGPEIIVVTATSNITLQAE